MFTLMDLDWKLLKPIKVIFFIKAGALNNKCVVIKFFKKNNISLQNCFSVEPVLGG